MNIAAHKIAVVTGALTGLGLGTAAELARQGAHVVLAGRHSEKGKDLAGGMKASFVLLDVSDCASIEEFCGQVLKSFGRVDILINNAGIFDDKDEPDLCRKAAVVEQTFKTNAMGPYLLCVAFVPRMVKNGFGRVVNISSGLSQLSDMGTGYPAYRMSKTALNAVTKMFAAEARGKNVLVNSVCPGWVKTRMGGEGAPRSIEEGIKGILWAATLPDGGPTGGFFRDGQPIDF